MNPPDTIGPYRLLETLGRGAMGVVYLAEHLHSGSRVALKTVAVPRQELLSSVRREIHTLARTAHPGLVRILDNGLHNGVPWYAMELVQGASLRRCAERKPRPALGEMLTVVRRLCAPLAYLHGEGIVHRDLKLDNVMVRAASGERRAASEEPEDSAALAAPGWPVLVDFGIVASFAGRLSREELELSAVVSGSVDTMAPEQVRAELVDARADLYSLGCMLYELVTGQPPFVGSTARAVLLQHLEAEPAPPSQRAEGVSPKLEELILRLLSKQARDRPGHAGVVAEALAGLGAEDGAAGAAPPARAYLYRPGLAGRNDALGDLEEDLARLEERRGGGVRLVAGESGVGKTRLMLELGRLTGRRELIVLAGECVEQGTRPLQGLSRPLQAIADRCRERGAEETQRLLGRRGNVLGLYEPALLGLPGQVEVHAETQNLASEHAPLPAEAALLRLYAFLAETLAALGQEWPVLLLLDDLQWADELTLGFLDHLLRARNPGIVEAQILAPLLVVGTYRTEEAGLPAAAPLQRLIEATQRVTGREPLRLGRLEEAAVASMVADMLAVMPPEPFVRFLSRQSEGNPFFVAEILRTAVAEEHLGRDGQGRWQLAPGMQRPAAGGEDYATLPLPGSVRELVDRRLRGLPAEALALAQAAAVVGRESGVALLQRMLGFAEPRLLEASAELLRRQVLEEARAGELRFVHDKIREVAYEGIEAGSRGGLHRAAAEGIEALPGSEAHLAALGHHWERAGDPLRARECFLEAARDAARHFAHADAERLYRAYFALVRTPTAESVAARSELGVRVLYVRAKVTEAFQEQRLALEEARALGDPAAEAWSLRSLASIWVDTNRMEEALPLLEQACKLAREAGQPFTEGKARTDLGTLHLRQGRLDEALVTYREALELARAAGDRRGEGFILMQLARIYAMRDSPDAASFFEQALAIHREIGDRWCEVLDLTNLGALYSNQGRIEERRAVFEQALPIAREVGDRRAEGILLNNLGYDAAERGQVEPARLFYEQSLSIAREVGDSWCEALVFQCMATLDRRIGAFDLAEPLLEQSERVLRGIGDVYFVAVSLCERAHLSLARGRAARGLLDEARQVASPLRLGPADELSRSIAGLERAVEAFEAGRPLFHGERIEDLPEGLRRRAEQQSEEG